jgi:hypothetical protein
MQTSETGATVAPSVNAQRMPRYVFVFFLSVYLLVAGRERPWGDANPIFQAAQNLVRSGTVAVTVRWPEQQEPGRKGHYYAINPALTSAIHLPGVILRELALGVLNPDLDEHLLPWASHLGPAAAGALVCSLFFMLCMDLGASAFSAGTATMLLGLGSTVFVYARSGYSEITQAAAFIGFIRSLFLIGRDPTAKRGLSVGLWISAIVNTKVVFVLAVPGPALLLAWVLSRNEEGRRSLARVAVSIALGLVPGVMLAVGYNWLRFGHVAETGYGAFLAGSTLFALWGMLASPGKSVLLYSPVLLLALFGYAALFKRHKFAVWLALSSMIPVVLIHARLPCWSGDFAWGPRYLVFAVPVLCVPLALVFETSKPRARRVLFTLALAVGGLVQIVGSAVHWDHYIRIVHEAEHVWLGSNQSKESDLVTAWGRQEVCFKDGYPLQWLPPFSPVMGHAWLLRSALLHEDWTKAEEHAPWRPFTFRRLDVSNTYQRVRLDWWPMDWSPWAAAVWGFIVAAGIDFGRRRISVLPPP